MPNPQDIFQLAQQTATQVTASPENWRRFLYTAAHNYHTTYLNQLLIHAQRPDATACATMKYWNEQAHRKVMYGSKSIIILQRHQGVPTAKRVFSMTDTVLTGDKAAAPWEVTDVIRPLLMQVNSVGSLMDRATEQVISLSERANRVLATSIEDSTLGWSHPEDQRFILQELAAQSTLYMICIRLGIPVQEEDFTAFQNVTQFDTSRISLCLGGYVQAAAEPLLDELGHEVMQLARDSVAIQAEPVHNTDTQSPTQTTSREEAVTDDVHEREGLSDSEPELAESQENQPEPVRQDAAVLLGAERAEPVRPDDAGGNAAAELPQDGAGCAADGGQDAARSDAESADARPQDEPSGLGTDVQQPEAAGGGNDPSDAVRSITEEPAAAESEPSPSAFSLPEFPAELLPSLLKADTTSRASNADILSFFSKTPLLIDRLRYIRESYKVVFTELLLDDDTRVGFYKESNGLLVWQGSYLTRSAESHLSWHGVTAAISALVDNHELIAAIDPKKAVSQDEQLSFDLPENASRGDEVGAFEVDDIYSEEEQDEKIKAALPTYHYKEPQPDDGSYITEDDVNVIITRGSVFEGGKYRIYNHFQQEKTEKETVAFLKKEYGIGGFSWTFADGGSGFVSFDGKGFSILYDFKDDLRYEKKLKWKEVGKRLEYLVRMDRYLTDAEREKMPAWINRQTESKSLPPPIPDQKPVCEVGSTVYLENDQRFTVESIGQFDVHLRNEDFPLVGRAVSREQFQQLLDANPRNGGMVLSEQQREFLVQEQREQALSYIEDYLKDEFEITQPDFSDLTKIGLGYTTTEDEQHTIQVNADLEHCTISKFVDDTLYAQEKFSSLEEMNRKFLSILDFDSLMEVDINEIEEQEPEISADEPEESTFVSQVMQDLDRLAAREEPAEYDRTNYLAPYEPVIPEGAKAKFAANVQAIRTLKEIEQRMASGGAPASEQEQDILAGYLGWGGLADAFDPGKDNWHTEYEQLKALLTEDEYAAARESTLTAFYTPPAVIHAMYRALEHIGCVGGNVLEPSMGVGAFFGHRHSKFDTHNAKLYGVELDPVSGRIAKQLYPKADITVGGFETTDRRDFFDLAIGNVPFGQYQVNDKAYNKLNFNIHNYFFAKALDQVRPGGVVAFVTSRYTMDAKDSTVRRYLAQRAELLGAIRLPNDAFKKNAGAEVVSDIIFLQKRDRPLDIAPEWTQTGIIRVPAKSQDFVGEGGATEQASFSPQGGNEQAQSATTQDGFVINRYFIDHPEMVLGRQEPVSTAHGMDYTVNPIEGLELSDQLHDAVKYIHGTYQEAELPELGEGEAIDTSIPADPNVKNYSYAIVDGQVYYRENSRMVRPDLNATAEARVKGLVGLRDCVQELIDLQMDAAVPDSTITQKQAELNRLYDSFSAKYGLINDRANRLAYADDSSYYLLCALEVIDEDGKLERKADMFTKRTIKPHQAVATVDTASEALAVSISEKACVDMSYMSRLTGKTKEALAGELQGVIFRVPGQLEQDGTPHYVTADEYLSGNVRRKLRQAQRAAQQDPSFAVNVEALNAAQPKDLDASEIEVRLGATWIDKEYIQQFMYETFNTPFYLQRSIEVNYSSFTAEWQIKGKSSVSYNDVAAYTTYGTSRANAYKILEDSLNLRDVRIYDTIEDADGKERRVLNAKETTLAAQKQQAIREAFRDWIWRDPERRQTLVRQYNEEMNSTRPREYDGSHITFGGMNPAITLREHQKSAIAHVLYGGNTLLAHEVGAGKTFEMVAAAMEAKRLGLCQKSLFVVPNHLTEQWASEFLRLYPSANILVTTKKDFETHNRKKFCARIATGDYDAIIMGHSQFERIPISRERQERLLYEQIDEITEGIAEVQASGGERFTVKQLERTRKSLEARLEKLQAEGRKDDVVTFEQLGVDRLFVDEAHNYKNLFLYTKMRNVAGLSTSDAQKSSDMFAKCRYMDEITGNRGVIFATGTPVSNSMTELYTMQRYLQYERLQELNMTHFDCWASRFGETVTALELAPEGTGYRARTRFSKFFNLPELMNLFKEVADIKTADQLNLPTPEVEYHNIVAQPTEHQQEMVKALSERASLVHSGTVDPSQDNMLKITSDGRKLGLDQRIVNQMLPDEPGTKVNQCVDNIMQIWRDGKADKLTQLVFCDISTPQAKAPVSKAAKTLDNPLLHALEGAVPLPEQEPVFTVYDDIRQKLIAQGMPADQIAFIHEANTEVRKKELFSKVRTGQVRVLLGSTAKMGAGTNVQDRLVALHDLDCPWRPGDLAQRKGRIERQGNQNPLVHVYRYVTEGTFDAYLWQTVENKQKFISQIMTSKSPVRSCDDVDETALSFAEIKALCAGDPRIKERMDLDVEVSRLKLMKADHQSKQYRLEDQLLKYFPEEIEKHKGFIKGFESDLEVLTAHPHPEDGFAGMEIRGDLLTDKENAGAALLDACKEVKTSDSVQIGSYRGFTMLVEFEAWKQEYTLLLKGQMTHRATLGTDPRGNLTRIDNALAQMPQRLEAVKNQLENLYQQQVAAKEEVGKPFLYEEELRSKNARLVELDTLLNIDGKGQAHTESVVAKSTRPSVLDNLKRPVQPRSTDKKPKQHEEVR